jgi:hypothetical protein
MFYAIEKEIRGRSAKERRLTRKQKSRPLADAFEQWLRVKLGLISQEGKLADAIRYALSRWEGPTRFIEDGRVELDNNAVERAVCRFGQARVLLPIWLSPYKSSIAWYGL